MHPVDPRNGVRYEFFLVESGEERARYRCEVHTAEGVAGAEVEIGREGATLLRSDEGIDDARRAQLVALARTIGRRDDAPWPRRVNRWRAPGVR